MNLIRDLAVSYIQRSICIILLTVSCEGMFHLDVQSPFHLIVNTVDFVSRGAHRLA